jgi:hypothetical protein
MRRPVAWRFPLAAPALAAVLACAESSPLPPSDGFLALGTWGADNAGVIVTPTAVHVHVGCTFGDMPGEIPIDAEGRFIVDGEYVLQAYPVQVGPSLPAQFSGRVTGRTLTLAIAVNDTVENKVVALGPVTVTFGREPKMGPCPICRAPAGQGDAMRP